jgi:hypothetical protein
MLLMEISLRGLMTTEVTLLPLPHHHHLAIASHLKGRAQVAVIVTPYLIRTRSKRTT